MAFIIGAWTTAVTLAAQDVAPKTASPAPLIREALGSVLDHQMRWAYTETQMRIGKDGARVAHSVHRFDPSKPYAEQYTPITVNGKPATEKDRKKAIKRGEQIAKRRLEARSKPAVVTEPGASRDEEVNLSLQGRKVKPQIDQARVIAEDETTLTVLVPLLPSGERDRILEKFELSARINKATRQFEQVLISQQEPLRMKLVAKVSALKLTIGFSTPDPKYPAFATNMSANGSFALFWGRNRDFAMESVRSDLKHVTPYDERFQVQVGEARTIEF